MATDIAKNTKNNTELVSKMLRGRDIVDGCRLVAGGMTVEEAFEGLGNIDLRDAERAILEGCGGKLQEEDREAVCIYVAASVYKLLIRGIYIGITGKPHIVKNSKWNGDSKCIDYRRDCLDRSAVPENCGVSLLSLFEVIARDVLGEPMGEEYEAKIEVMRVMIAKC